MPDPLAGAGLQPPTSTSTPDSSEWLPGAPEVATAAKRVGDPENPLDDLWQNVKGLGEGVGHVVKGYYDLATDPKARDEWQKGWSYLANNRGMPGAVGGHLWNGLKNETTSHYTDPEGNFDLGYSFWHHPASMLLDLSVVKDAAAGGAKVYGKMAGGASRAILTAEQAAKLGPLTTADKMIQWGEKLDKIPLDPLTLAAKGVGATPVGKWLKEELGFGPNGEHKFYDPRLANEQAMVNAELSQKQKLLLEAKLGEGSGDRVLNALDRGSQADYAALKPEELDFVNRYKATQGIGKVAGQTLELPEREKMLKERGYIPEDTSAILAKQAAVREWGEGGLTEDRLGEAVAKVKSGEWNPTYRFLAHEKGHEYSMLDNLMADARGERLPGGGQGVGAQLRERTGMGTYEKDPLVATFKQMGMEAQMDRRIRMKDALLDLAQKRGELKVIRNEAALPQGWKIMPTEAWEREMVASKRAAGLALSQEMRGLDKAGAARAAYEQLLKDPRTLEAIKSNKLLAAPNWLANYMRFRLAIPGPLARTYDNAARYWKSWATILRPSYWINVAGGNGFLAALHGVSPMDAARFWRNRKFLPPELQAIQQLPKPGAGIYQRAVSGGRNLDSIIHTYVDKGPAFAHGVEPLRRQAQALSDVGHKFDISKEVLADADKWHQMVAQGPQKLSQMVRDHVVAREQLARYAPEVAGKAEEFAKADAQAEKFLRKGRVGEDFYQAAMKRESLQTELQGLQEQHMRTLERDGIFQKNMPEAQQIADWAEKAVGPANDLQGAYLRLHPLERTWLSRAIPFYPWVKAMSALAFRLPFMYPKQTFMWNRFSETMNDLMSHEEHTPPWLRGALHVGMTSDGAHVFVKPFWDPFRSAEPIKWGGLTLPGIAGGFLRHPLLKVLFDGNGGTDSFTMKPWSMDETMTRSSNGEVYKLDPKTGYFERSIAQPSIWKRLWGLFPESQMIDQLFLPHVQTDKGWVGHPDPIKDAGGNPMFPTPFYQRATRALLPVMYRTEDQKMMEERKQNRLYKDFVKEIRHMPPDEQTTAMQALEDAFRVRK